MLKIAREYFEKNKMKKSILRVPTLGIRNKILYPTWDRVARVKIRINNVD